ncbi:MAG: OmpA family protein [Methylomonas sp.]
MNKKYIYIPLAVLAVSLTACSTPKRDVAGLTAEIDGAYKGHYGQSVYHAMEAAKDLKTANHVLKHWENDYYWNIDETLKAQEASRSAAAHILASEKEHCQWLTEVHGPNHQHEQHPEPVHETVAYFKTNKDVPFKVKDESIRHIGAYLHEHPESTATVTASTDTVGKADYNQRLSERRASHVRNLLVKDGANPAQLNVQATGKADGPDQTPDQNHRVAVVVTNHPKYIDTKYMDCANVK